MPPIHASINESGISRRALQHGKRIDQKCGELLGAQLADPLNELSVPDATFPRNKSINRQIVGRINEAHARAQAPVDLLNEGLITSVATANAVAAAGPDLADGCDRRALGRRNLLVLGDIELRKVDVEKAINLDRIEAGELEVEAQIDKRFQLFAEPIVVPSGILGDPIKCEPESLDFRVCAIGHDDGCNLAASELAHSHPDGVPVHEDTMAVDDDRNDLPEMPDQPLEFIDLAFVVDPRMPEIGLDLVN